MMANITQFLRSKRTGVQCRLLTSNSGWDGPLQGSDCGPSDLLRGVLLAAGLTGSHHVGLEECALQEDVVVSEGLVLEGQHLQHTTSVSRALQGPFSFTAHSGGF